MNEEKMKKDCAWDFLIYSYFGIVPESIYNDIKKSDSAKEEYRDYCIKMVIIKAYEDATGQGAYNALFTQKNLGEKLAGMKDKSKEVKKEAATYIFNQIKDLASLNDYDTWHYEVCKELVEKYYIDIKNKDGNFFTYGNAQKWVNMTMKYLWLLGWLPDGVKEEKLHIPIDSYMIDALWKNKNVDLPLDKGDRSKSYSQPSDYVLPWSKWDYEKDYKECQDSLNESDSNMQQENTTWIKQAEIRKEKENKTKYPKFFVTSSAENNSKE